jgi:hypothetical protein
MADDNETNPEADPGPQQRAPYDPMPHGPAEVGVGPWSGPLPVEAWYDAELLTHGDRRNVVDRYRYWSMAAIVADLDARRHDFHVAIENWQHDFNIGTIVRTANAFLAAEVHIVGNRRWNRRGAMVTDRYQHLRHHDNAADLAADLHAADVQLLGIDNLPGVRRHPLDRPVRLHPFHQCLGGSRDRDALLDPRPCGSVRGGRRTCVAGVR